MIIQSRINPERTEEVSLETWNDMKSKDLARNWKMLSSHDVGPVSTIIPEEVVNFMNTQEVKVEKIYEASVTEDIAPDEIEYEIKPKRIRKPKTEE